MNFKFVYAFSSGSYNFRATMLNVEKIKYTIWAADSKRAANFYQSVFGATIVRQNPHITELEIAGGLIAIHGGGEGNKTWTGITLQVADVVAGAAAVRDAGG